MYGNHSGGKENNKHKQLGGIVLEMGGGQIVYMCFPFSLGKKETHKQNSQEISGKAGTVPGQSRENFVYVFFLFIDFLPALIIWTV